MLLYIYNGRFTTKHAITLDRDRSLWKGEGDRLFHPATERTSTDRQRAMSSFAAPGVTAAERLAQFVQRHNLPLDTLARQLDWPTSQLQQYLASETRRHRALADVRHFASSYVG